jgi:glycosyltransferase involved in cell wall biosynthesis
MRRILHIITKSELGGAQSHVADLLAGFRSSDTKQFLATGAEGPLTEHARELGVQVHLLPRLQRSVNPLVDLAAVRECAHLLRRVRPHIVHAHSSKAGVVARLAGHRTGVPVVFTAHGWGFSPGTPLARRTLALAVEAAIAPLSARIICVSESDRQLALAHHVGTKRSLVTIRHGLAPSDVRARPADQPPRLLMVARFNEQKDQSTLLRAVARLEQIDKNLVYTLDLVGSGPNLERVRSLAGELNVLHRVSFLGDRHDVPTLLGAAQLFVLSTHYEGLPISIIEALRAGLPVVATDVSGIKEEVAHNETGLLVPHRDEIALADALQKIIKDPQMRARMGKLGRQKFEAEFTRARMLLEIERLYAQVQSERNTRRS